MKINEHPICPAAMLGARTAYNRRIADIPMPPRIKQLPVNQEGWPELFFAAPVDNHGRKDLRVADERKRVRCFQADLCWLCGERLGRYQSVCDRPYVRG